MDGSRIECDTNCESWPLARMRMELYAAPDTLFPHVVKTRPPINHVSALKVSVAEVMVAIRTNAVIDASPTENTNSNKSSV